MGFGNPFSGSPHTVHKTCIDLHGVRIRSKSHSKYSERETKKNSKTSAWNPKTSAVTFLKNGLNFFWNRPTQKKSKKKSETFFKTW